MQSTELSRSIMTLEAEIKTIQDRHKKIEEAKLSFLLRILKHGIDSRDDGCLWILRLAAKQNVDIKDDILPDFIDQTSKEFILSKFQLFLKAAELRDKTSFQRSFYRILTKGYTMVEDVKRIINSRYKRETVNPMLEVIGEMNSISIKRRIQMSGLTAMRPGTVTYLPENHSFVDSRAKDQQLSAIPLVEKAQIPYLTNRQATELERQSSIERPEGEALDGEHRNYPEISFKDPGSPTIEPEVLDKEPRKMESVQVRSRVYRSFADPGRVGSVIEQANTDAQNIHSTPLSANIRMKMLSARSCFSLADSAIVKKKQAEFTQRGIVYIGDANYPFNSDNFVVDHIAESTQIGNELISQAMRTHNKRLMSQYSSKSRLQSSRLRSSSRPNMLQESTDFQSNKMSASHSVLASHVTKEDAADDSEDMLATHIKFYEDDTLINNFDSKQAMIKQQVADLQSSTGLTQKYLA